MAFVSRAPLLPLPASVAVLSSIRTLVVSQSDAGAGRLSRGETLQYSARRWISCQHRVFLDLLPLWSHTWDLCPSHHSSRQKQEQRELQQPLEEIGRSSNICLGSGMAVFDRHGGSGKHGFLTLRRSVAARSVHHCPTHKTRPRLRSHIRIPFSETKLDRKDGRERGYG